MKLVDMKLPKPKPDKKEVAGCIADGDKYPWGLRLDLNNDIIGKFIGIDKADVGSDITVHALARVIEKRSQETQNGSDTRMELQIIKISLDPIIDDQKAFDEGADDSSD